MNVGDYVRTKDGKIFKWSKLCTTDIKDWMEHTRKILFIEDEIKSSPNIIDLIEVGDYVNGMLVIEETPKDKRKKQQIIVDSTAFEWGTERLFNEEIKSIVTKEQFESIKYEVE